MSNRPIGSTEESDVDVRIIAVTNKDFEEIAWGSKLTIGPGTSEILKIPWSARWPWKRGKQFPARVLPDRILGYSSALATVPGASQGIAIPDEGVGFEKVVAATERLDMQAALEQRPLLCGGCMSLKLFSRARLLWCGPTKIRGTA